MDENIQKQDIKEYWEDPKTISMMDKNLHELETESIAREIGCSDSVFDIGCGDGTATRVYALKAKRTCAIEYSKTLYEKARQRNLCVPHVSLYNDDFMTMKEFPFNPTVIISQRFLINLVSSFEQQRAIQKILELLPSGGLFILAENFDESFERMNKMRQHLDLDPIKRHWHNTYLNENRLRCWLAPYAEVESIQSFDMYLLLTRIYVQMVKNFEKEDSLRLFDDAAKKLANSIDVSCDKPFGPNQTWVVRKK